MLPSFTRTGVLPPGDYPLTLEELRQSVLVRWPSRRSRTWDAAWRGQLVDNLEVVVGHLWQIGIDRIFVDGSFVEDKDRPHDIDGYFECSEAEVLTGILEAHLSALDPVWTWNPATRTAARGKREPQLPMWHKYHVELYPHFGQDTGIRDRHGNPLEFPAAFRRTRSDVPKGIVQIVRRPIEEQSDLKEEQAL